MIAPAPAKLGTIAPQLQVLDLPFIADSPEEIQELFSRGSKIGQAIYQNEELQSRNMKVLGLWDLGFKQFASKQPIRSLEDIGREVNPLVIEDVEPRPCTSTRGTPQ